MRAVVNLQNRPATPLPAAYRGSGLAETTPVVIAGREEGSVPRPPIIRLMRGVRSGRPPVDGTSQSAPPEAKPDTGCPSLLNSRLAGSNPFTRLSLFHPIRCIPGFEFPSRNGSAPIPGVRVHDGHHRSGSEGRPDDGLRGDSATAHRLSDCNHFLNGIAARIATRNYCLHQDA